MEGINILEPLNSAQTAWTEQTKHDISILANYQRIFWYLFSVTESKRRETQAKRQSRVSASATFL